MPIILYDQLLSSVKLEGKLHCSSIREHGYVPFIRIGINGVYICHFKKEGQSASVLPKVFDNALIFPNSHSSLDSTAFMHYHISSSAILPENIFNHINDFINGNTVDDIPILPCALNSISEISTVCLLKIKYRQMISVGNQMTSEHQSGRRSSSTKCTICFETKRGSKKVISRLILSIPSETSGVLIERLLTSYILYNRFHGHSSVKLFQPIPANFKSLSDIHRRAFWSSNMSAVCTTLPVCLSELNDDKYVFVSNPTFNKRQVDSETIASFKRVSVNIEIDGILPGIVQYGKINDMYEVFLSWPSMHSPGVSIVHLSKKEFKYVLLPVSVNSIIILPLHINHQCVSNILLSFDNFPLKDEEKDEVVQSSNIESDDKPEGLGDLLTSHPLYNKDYADFTNRDDFITIINDLNLPNITIPKLPDIFIKVIERWRHWELTNYSLIMFINNVCLSKFHSKNINQKYPIFPLLVNYYEFPTIDLFRGFVCKVESISHFDNDGELSPTSPKCLLNKTRNQDITFISNEDIEYFKSINFLNFSDYPVIHGIASDDSVMSYLESIHSYNPSKYFDDLTDFNTSRKLQFIENFDTKTNSSNLFLPPEFYTLNTPHKNMHIRVPMRGANYEEFVDWNRRLLETQFVSIHIHEWLNLLRAAFCFEHLGILPTEFFEEELQNTLSTNSSPLQSVPTPLKINGSATRSTTHSINEYTINLPCKLKNTKNTIVNRTLSLSDNQTNTNDTKKHVKLKVPTDSNNSSSSFSSDLAVVNYSSQDDVNDNNNNIHECDISILNCYRIPCRDKIEYQPNTIVDNDLWYLCNIFD